MGKKIIQPMKIDINVKSFSQVVGDSLDVALDISVFKGNVPLSDVEVVLKEGASIVGASTSPVLTTKGGLAVLNISFPVLAKETKRELRICLAGYTEEVSKTILIPAKQVIKDVTETLMVFKHQGEDGKLNFKLRVLDTDGSGVENKTVGIFFQGHNYQVVTDEEGEAIFPDSTTAQPVEVVLKEGEDTYIIFSVSGIKDKVRMPLRRRKTLQQAKAFTKAWWLGVNNGRSFLAFIATSLLLLLTVIIGAEPLIQRGFFSGPSGLSSAQAHYNDIMTNYGYVNELIAPVKSGAGFPWWTVSILLFLSSIVYMLISAREEIGEAFDEVKIKMLERRVIETSDPFIERLVATSESLGIISNKKKNSSNSSGSGSGDGASGKPFIGPQILSYLSLDLFTDFIRGATRRIFK